jgi:hypothetical protein
MPLPKRYEIVRDVINGSRIQLNECPVRVWTLLNEEGFKERGLIHWDTAFLEDKMHDWDWRNGQFHFYGHSDTPGSLQTLLIIYEL